MNSKSLAAAALACAAGFSAQASTSYSYAGPAFAGSADHLSVSFTTSAPLAPSKSYLSLAAAGATASSVSVVSGSTVLPGFSLPVQTFQVHTDAAGAIDSWFIVGDVSNLAGTAPTMSGVHWQAYTMNTLVFIPGSDVPGAVGLVTGAYDYDQATETTFYASCSGAPAGCTLAGNGQPYVGNYSGIINPSGTSGAWWKVSTSGSGGGTPAPLTLSGSLPSGTIGAPYSATLTASGGAAPYAWADGGLPAGLQQAAGTISGTPTSAGSFTVAVKVTDSAGAVASRNYSLQIGAAASCTRPQGAPARSGSGRVSAVGPGYVKVGALRIDYAACTHVDYGNDGAAPAVGNSVEWEGYGEGSNRVMAQTLSFN